jgi:hypothetical protein
MANFHRGELEIELQGPNGPEKYTLRLTFNAFCEIEERTGKPIFDIIYAMSQRKVPTLSDMTAIVWAGIRGGFEDRGSDKRQALSFEGTGERVMRTGVASLMGPLLIFLHKGLATDEQISEAEQKAKKDQPSVEAKTA